MKFYPSSNPADHPLSVFAGLKSQKPIIEIPQNNMEPNPNRFILFWEVVHKNIFGKRFLSS